MRCSAVGEFSFAVSRFASQAKEKEKLVIRKIAIECFRRIILGTPVDTGRARGNWQASTGSMAGGTVEKLDTTGSATIAAMISEVSGWTPKDDLPAFITNNLPYIQRLNEGWSKQAPAHFVEQVVADMGGIVEASV
jgi:hypothetical protein